MVLSDDAIIALEWLNMNTDKNGDGDCTMAQFESGAGLSEIGALFVLRELQEKKALPRCLRDGEHLIWNVRPGAHKLVRPIVKGRPADTAKAPEIHILFPPGIAGFIGNSFLPGAQGVLIGQEKIEDFALDLLATLRRQVGQLSIRFRDELREITS